MDEFECQFIGRRDGHVCPCCAENGNNKGKHKRLNTSAAKARFRKKTRELIEEVLAEEE